MKKRLKIALRENEGVWTFIMGNKSFLNPLGKVVLFPIWLFMATIFFIIGFLFVREDA